MVSLNKVMEFGHVVQSDGRGKITDMDGIGPEIVYLLLDADGQSLDDDILDMPEGWELLTGFTGQDSYHGPVMHPSEYVGGRMGSHIRENAGYYCAVMVDGFPEENGESVPIGWAVAYREVAE